MPAESARYNLLMAIFGVYGPSLFDKSLMPQLIRTYVRTKPSPTAPINLLLLRWGSRKVLVDGPKVRWRRIKDLQLVFLSDVTLLTVLENLSYSGLFTALLYSRDLCRPKCR